MTKMKNCFVFILVFVLTLCLVACGGEKGPTGPLDQDKVYSDISKTLKLDKEFEGKSFLTDGIGEATVDAYTDGDTVRFRLKQGDIIIIRFYEIDTPESTSSIEKWGRGASNFTKKALQSATQIVLEATGPRAVHDSYGTRYLGYVWFKTADSEDFINLNLMLVENGWSDNKGMDTADYPYYYKFKRANDFARSGQLHLYFNGDDPLYSTDPVPMTLKEFANNEELFYDPDTNTGAKVKLNATLIGLRVASSGTYTFTAAEYDEEDNIVRTIDLYAGYVSSSASQLIIGDYYEFVGDLSQYNGRFQISNITFDPLFYKAGDSKKISRRYYLTFDSTVAFRNQYTGTLYSNLVVTNVTEDDETITIVGTARKAIGYKNNMNTYAEEAETFTIKVPKPEGYNGNIKVNDVLSFGGYKLTEGEEYYVIKYSDITK